MAEHNIPDWLDPIVKLSDFEGDAEKYVTHLFAIFTKDFIVNSPVFRGGKILFDKSEDNGKPKAFIHIITEENKSTREREICLRRCERIGWIKSIIEHHEDESVLVWEEEHFGKRRISKRIYLFLECDDFLIILEETKWGHYMITAIYVDSPHQKRKHLRTYQNFLNNKDR